MATQEQTIEILKKHKIIRKNQKVIINPFGKIEFSVSTHDGVFKLYNKWRKMSTESNFRGNPCDQNMYMIIKCDNGKALINPPTALNGDIEWLSYKNTKTIITLTYMENGIQ